MNCAPARGFAALAFVSVASCGAAQGAGMPCSSSISCASDLECVSGACAVRAPADNAPVRILSGLSIPEQRETVIRVGASCAPPTFSIKADDPDGDDTIRALWFIDPTDRYLGGVPGNNGTLVYSVSTVRSVTAPRQFLSNLSAIADGRKHRVEVVVTDGDFVEDVRTDADGNPQPFLGTARPAIRAQGQTWPVTAFRDEYVWLVRVDTTPCP